MGTKLKGVDGNGNNIEIYVPNWGLSSPTSSSEFPNRDYTSISNLKEYYANFDENVTLFCSNALTYNLLHDFGFPYVVMVEDINYKITFSNGAYVLFESTGLTGSYIIHYYNVNDVYYASNSAIISSTSAMSICSFLMSLYRGNFDSFMDLEVSNVGEISFRCGIANIKAIFGTNASGQYLQNGIDFWAGVSPYTDNDPYENGGVSDVDGGGGDFDDENIAVDIPDLPTVNFSDLGMITLFSPTVAQLKALAAGLWSNDFYNAITKMFISPMDAIIGLGFIPISVPTAGTKNLKVGGIEVKYFPDGVTPTSISMNYVSTQYVNITFGELNVNEFWGAYLDYSPYTKIDIYLPYIGIRSLNVDDIMNKTIRCDYNIDIMSGSCIAFLKCGDSVLYQFTGNVMTQIPISASNFNNIISSALSVATASIAGASVGGFGGMVGAGLASSAAQVGNAKPSIERSGAIVGSGAMLAIQYPYLILTRPRQALPANQNKYTGYPSFITENLSDLDGYTEIEYIHLESVPATDAELNEIESILKSGVIF